MEEYDDIIIEADKLIRSVPLDKAIKASELNLPKATVSSIYKKIKEMGKDYSLVDYVGFLIAKNDVDIISYLTAITAATRENPNTNLIIFINKLYAKGWKPADANKEEQIKSLVQKYNLLDLFSPDKESLVCAQSFWSVIIRTFERDPAIFFEYPSFRVLFKEKWEAFRFLSAVKLCLLFPDEYPYNYNTLNKLISG